MQALGCWELPVLHAAWQSGGLDAVWAEMESPAVVTEEAVHGMAESRSTRPVMVGVPSGHSGVGGAVHVYATGFRASPYADVKPAGEGTAAPRRLWHSSSGSAGG
jgi:error-prone DNA polymerase